MKLVKRIALLTLPAVLLVSASCGANPNEPEEEEYRYTGEYTFSTIFYDNTEKVLPVYDATAPSAGNVKAPQNVVYDVYRSVGDQNYFRFQLETDVDLVGYVSYSNPSDPSQSNVEKFFIESGTTEFTMFLDAFRVGAYGAFPKRIDTLSFENVDSEKEGRFILTSVGVSDRTMDIYDDMYITDGTMKFGTSLTHGGSIKYIGRTDSDVCEYMDSDGNIRIDKDIDPDYYDVTNDDVNFINIFDLGREIQPSYYLKADASNGYNPKTELLYDGLEGAMYNPIQCGSDGKKTPQIIDYEYKEDHIFVKTKAQDWFYDNDQANGYIETTYSFDGDGILVVDNRYTDFSQFVESETNPLTFSTQETPATYFVYPLNYFYCETRQGTIFDNTLKPQNGQFTCKTTKTQSVSGGYFYGIEGKNVKYDWCAFVNENKFGIGIYMPNADVFVASRGASSCSYYQEDTNRQYIPTLFDFAESQVIPSYSAFNYNYINPGVRRRMVDFIPLSYSYAIYIGETTEMKNIFGTMRENGMLTNSQLVDGSGWPKK